LVLPELENRVDLQSDLLLDNSKDPRIEYLKGKKAYHQERNEDLFDLIQKGSVVSDGKLYEAIFKMLVA